MMTLRAVVGEFTYKINPYFPWSLTAAGFTAFVVAMQVNPAPEVHVAA